MRSVTFDHGIFVAQKYGGVSRYFVELARHLARQGVDVTIDSPLYVSDGVSGLAANGVRVHGLHVPVFRGVTFLGNSLARGLPRPEPAGVLHETWYGSRGRRRCRGPLVTTLHDLNSDLFPDDVQGASRQSRDKREAVARADLVLCVSQTTRDDAIRLLDLDPSRLRVTALAASLPVLPRQAPDKPFVLYVGQRGGYKDFALALRAFALSKRLRGDFRLLCFGGGAFSDDELAMARTAGDVVQINGDDAVLATCYAGASALMHTSRYEGFGLPLLEAMAAGCPVVAVPGGAAPEVAGDAASYVAFASPEGVADALESMLYDAGALEDAAARGLARSRLFSWERTARETSSAYDAIV